MAPDHGHGSGYAVFRRRFRPFPHPAGLIGDRGGRVLPGGAPSGKGPAPEVQTPPRRRGEKAAACGLPGGSRGADPPGGRGPKRLRCGRQSRITGAAAYRRSCAQNVYAGSLCIKKISGLATGEPHASLRGSFCRPAERRPLPFCRSFICLPAPAGTSVELTSLCPLPYTESHGRKLSEAGVSA